jgi:DNA mismatch repair protein MutS
LEISETGNAINNHGSKPNPKVNNSKSDYQLSFFQLNDPVLESVKDELIKVDINTLTPVEALMKLNDIKRMLGG